MESNERDGRERRAEPDLDINDNGTYANIAGKTFYSPNPNDNNIGKYMPAEILKLVDSSKNRLRIKTYSRDDDDCFTQYTIQKFERRKEPSEDDSPFTLGKPSWAV